MECVTKFRFEGEFGGRSRSSSAEEEVGGWWVLLIELFWPNADLDEDCLHKVLELLFDFNLIEK